MIIGYMLQNIVKQFTPDTAGYSTIVNALSTMTAIAHHINEMKRRHEHAVRVQEIQSLLLGWEVSTVYCGPFVSLCPKQKNIAQWILLNIIPR